MKYNTFVVKAIIISPKFGQNIYDVLEEAKGLCVKYEVPVEFVLSGVKCRFDFMPEQEVK